jgi:hypothetical protein
MTAAPRAHEAQPLAETRAGRETHPALALLRAGQVAEAIAYLREHDDHPAGLALLEAGFADYAETVLVGRATTTENAPGRPQRARQGVAAEKGGEAAGDPFQAQEMACQRRRA